MIRPLEHLNLERLDTFARCRGLSKSTLYRYVKEGCNGIHLRVQYRPIAYTCDKWYDEFLEKVNAVKQDKNCTPYARESATTANSQRITNARRKLRSL